jgi:hypothetical protein
MSRVRSRGLTPRDVCAAAVTTYVPELDVGDRTLDAELRLIELLASGVCAARRRVMGRTMRA